MNSQKILSKFFIIWLLVFLLINNSSLGANQDSSQSSDNRDDPIPFVFGIIGANGWYITVATISFEYDPDIVEEIQYYHNNKWNVYTGPFNVNEDGKYKISWFWIDKKGDTHTITIPIGFKIDRTPPTIKLTKKSSGENKVIFTATTSDEISQIERVEFYLDDELQLTDDESPYQYTWTGNEHHWVFAISYNYAGLSEESNKLSTPRPFLKNYYVLQRLLNMIQLLLKE